MFDVVSEDSDCLAIGMREHIYFRLAMLREFAHVEALGALFGGARALKLPDAERLDEVVGEASTLEGLLGRVRQLDAVDEVGAATLGFAG